MIQSAGKLLPWFLCICTGCATVELKPPTTRDEIVSRANRRLVPSEGWQARASVAESSVGVDTLSRCNAVEDVEILRTRSSERVNASAKLDYWLAAAGVGSVALGAWYLADAPNVYPNDTSSHTYNEYGPQTARAAGYAFVGLGAVLLAIPVIDLIRTSGSEVSTSIIREPRTIASNVACERQAIARGGLSVGVRIGESTIPLGQTNDAGRFEVDLAEAIPADVRIDQKGHAAIVVEGVRIATVELQAVSQERERSKWRAIDPGECTMYPRGSACDRIRRFIGEFPDSAHVQEAKSILDAAARREAEMTAREREAAERARAEREAAAERERIERERAQMEWERARLVREAEAAKERERAAQAARTAAECRNKCSSGCKGNQQCVSACVSASCR